MEELPSLIWFHNDMSPLGGAQREILTAIPTHKEKWNITFVTLNAPKEVCDFLNENNIPLITPKKPWINPIGGFNEITAKTGKSQLKEWKKLVKDIENNNLKNTIDNADAILISASGSLEMLSIIPDHIPLHAYLIEMHRGLHDDVLHRKLNGKPIRPLWLTKIMLNYHKKWDKKWHRVLWNRPNTSISSNTPTSARRLAKAHGWNVIENDSLAGNYPSRDKENRSGGVGVLWPAVNTNLWTETPSSHELNVWEQFEHKPTGEYLITVGRASYMKASLDALKIANHSKLPLVHIGGGNTAELEKEAQKLSAELIVMPRISNEEITALIRNATALIGIAHGEGFGLTPMEAILVGTPALVVNEAGFTHTITDNENGKRLPWPNSNENLEKWQEAIIQAKKDENRIKWSENGRRRIEERWTPKFQSEAIARTMNDLGVNVKTNPDIKILPGLDPA